jgi:hypothetical protein
MMPFWMFVLGRVYIPGTSINIPYLNIVSGLFSIFIPCCAGVILSTKRPEWGKKVVRAVAPIAIIFVLWVVIVGSITNTYVYPLMVSQWYVIPVAMLLPYSGMILGYLAARVLQQGNKRSVTISIETGMQDTGIAIILLLSSFQKPDGDLAATMPITCALFTPVPLMITYTIVMIYTRCWKTGKCTSCYGPNPLVLDDLAVVGNDDEEVEEVFSTTNTKNSELTPAEEKEKDLAALKAEEEMGQGDRLLNDHDRKPVNGSNGLNGHIV